MELHTLLEDEKSRLTAQKLKLQKRIKEAEFQLREVQVRLHHVEGLLGTSESNGMEAGEKAKNSTVPSLTDIAEEVLTERDREPMHYKDLAREVQSRGGNLSDENGANILVARLVNDDRFVRPMRKGYYALRRDYPNARNVGARKSRRA